MFSVLSSKVYPSTAAGMISVCYWTPNREIIRVIHCFVVERSAGPAKNTQHLNATYCNLAAAQHAAHVCLPCGTMRVAKHAQHAVRSVG